MSRRTTRVRTRALSLVAGALTLLLLPIPVGAGPGAGEGGDTTDVPTTSVAPPVDDGPGDRADDDAPGDDAGSREPAATTSPIEVAATTTVTETTVTETTAVERQTGGDLGTDFGITPMYIPGTPVTGYFTVEKIVEGLPSVDAVVPGVSFTYRVTVVCSNLEPGAGCTNAVLTDPLPPYVERTGEPIIVTGAPYLLVNDGPVVDIAFTEALGSPAGSIGLAANTSVEVIIPVQLSPSIPPAMDGESLVNEATAIADNALDAADDVTIRPAVETTLAAGAAKRFDPAALVAGSAGPIELTVEAENRSNVPVDTLVISDPADPAATGNPFDQLALTGNFGAVTFPAGAETVRIDVWTGSPGAWTDGEPGTDAALPLGIDPADVRGVRITFADTDGELITVGADAGVVIELTPRAGATPGVVTNAMSAMAGLDGRESAPAPGTATIELLDADLPLSGLKRFSPAEVAAGDPTTMTLNVVNAGDQLLDSLAIVEPAPGTATLAANGLTFTAITGVQWPTGATAVEIVYDTAAGPLDPLGSTTQHTVPQPPDPAAVIGFTVVFTGSIASGAEASLAVALSTDVDQTEPQRTVTNEFQAVATAPGGFSGSDTWTADLTTYERRLAIEVSKTIGPSPVLGVPGEPVVAQFQGHVLDFPTSTVNANEIVITDPADLDNDAWWAIFRPTAVVATPVPGGATLAVEWWDGTDWNVVAGMGAIAGPATFTGALPTEVRDDAVGLRFRYTSVAGFPPDSTVSPNLVFEVREDHTAEPPFELVNCAAADAETGPISADPDAQSGADCPTTEVVPSPPGGGDMVDKAWTTLAVPERSRQQAGATITWSTGGRSNLDRVVVTDTADPATTPIGRSVFDAFDLVRIDSITPALDPLIRYDQVLAVELYNGTAWVRAANDPCPTSCRGTFPGVTLTATERTSTVGFRLVFAEYDANRLNPTDPLAPAAGSGVARSFAPERPIRPVFQIRDSRRSDGGPVIDEAVFNDDADPPNAGQVINTVRASGFVGDDQVSTSTDADVVLITNVPVNINIAKTWTGGPLGVPPPDTPIAGFPSARATVTVTNQSVRYVDRLTITEPSSPTGNGPFDVFDLTRIVAITDPAGIGATGLTITVRHAGGPATTHTRAQALALTAAQLADATGFELVYTGRINPAASVSVQFDTRLRATNRTTEAPITHLTNPTVGNVAGGEVADLVDYPGVTPERIASTATATVMLEQRGIGVTTTKSFTPSSQTEPTRTPITMRLAGRPAGPSRTNVMTIVDTDGSFWNQYDVVDVAAFSFVAPVNRVRIDVLTGATFTADEAGGLTVTGGTWTEGAAWTAGDPGSPTLPSGIAPTDIQGLRVVFTRSDGALWQNPANPEQPISFRVQRRTELRSGGPVPSDLVILEPAPGETVRGQATNTIQTTVENTIDGTELSPLTATASATGTVRYLHARNAVTVTKSPTGLRPPASAIPYVLSFTNTGNRAIVDPVIVDVIPADGSGPLLVLDPDIDLAEYPFTFALTGAAPEPPSGPAMPVGERPDGVTITFDDPTGAAVGLITFEFPEGTVIEQGQTYTVSFPLRFRPGLPGNVTVTNTTSISGDRPWDACNGTNLATPADSCSRTATVQPQRAGALRSVKSVRADDAALGVANVAGDPATCVPNAAGFYVGTCVPLTKPGETNTWRVTFTNTGNLSMDRLYAIDRLPRPGDTGAIVPLPRDSRWRPTLLDVRLVGISGGTAGGALEVLYTTSASLCLDDLSLTGSCPPGAWLPWSASVDPDTIEALQFRLAFAPTGLLAPLGTVTIDIETRAPDHGPQAVADSVAWNSIGAAARTNDAGTLGMTPRAEGNKVGAALATGPLEIVKQLAGDGARFAPATFVLTAECTSNGTPIDLGDDATQVVAVDAAARIDVVPWGSQCTVSEDDAAGASGFAATTVTVGRPDEQVAAVVATNTYHLASIELTKAVVTDAVDAAGEPIAYGPFTVAVECTFLGAEVVGAGFTAGEPMEVVIAPGAPATITELPAGAACTVSESDTKGAVATSWSTQTAADDEPVITAGASAELVVTSDDDGAPTNHVGVENHFDVGELLITKVVTGDAAGFATGPFVVAVVCTLDDASGVRVVWDDTVTLDAAPWQHTIADIAAGADCEAEELDAGSATSTEIAPSSVTIVDASDDGAPSEIVVTNHFDVGAIAVRKLVGGDGGAQYGSGPFAVELTCSFPVAERIIEIPGGAERIVEPDGTATYEGLPIGAVCALAETDTAGASATTITAPDGSVDGTATVTAETRTFEVANRFDHASLVIAKVVTTDAVDAAGEPIAYGPFTVAVECTFRGAEVVGAGFTAGEPMEVVIAPGAPATITELPDGAACTATETDDKGASSTSSLARSGADDAPVAADGPEASLVLTSDDEGAATNSVVFENRFDVGELVIVKELTGDAAQFATGPFVVAVVCTLDDASGVRVVWDDTVTLDAAPWQHTIADLAAGAGCEVEEIETGGATSTAIDPAVAEVVVAAGDAPAATVVVTNHFDVGAIAVHKRVDGAGAEYHGAGPFTVELTCSFPVAERIIEIPGGAERIVEPDGTATYEGLPIGAVCGLAETATGGATATAITAPGDVADGTVTVTAETQTFEVANRFDTAMIRVAKRLTGPGAAGQAGATFRFTASCTRVVDGVTVAVEIPGGAERTVSAASGWEAWFESLPIGAACTVHEVGADADVVTLVAEGADTVIVDPAAAAAAIDVVVPGSQDACIEIAVDNRWSSAGTRVAGFGTGLRSPGSPAVAAAAPAPISGCGEWVAGIVPWPEEVLPLTR